MFLPTVSDTDARPLGGCRAVNLAVIHIAVNKIQIRPQHGVAYSCGGKDRSWANFSMICDQLVLETISMAFFNDWIKEGILSPTMESEDVKTKSKGTPRRQDAMGCISLPPMLRNQVIAIYWRASILRIYLILSH